MIGAFVAVLYIYFKSHFVNIADLSKTAEYATAKPFTIPSATTKGKIRKRSKKTGASQAA